MGGDEFLVLMPLAKELDFKASFRRLRELVGREQELSIALGSDWVADTTHLNEAICRTDRRMYSDKVEYYNRRGKQYENRHDIRSCRRILDTPLPLEDRRGTVGLLRGFALHFGARCDKMIPYKAKTMTKRSRDLSWQRDGTAGASPGRGDAEGRFVVAPLRLLLRRGRGRR